MIGNMLQISRVRSYCMNRLHKKEYKDEKKQPFAGRTGLGHE
jgi:hypothetical protein